LKEWEWEWNLLGKTFIEGEWIEKKSNSKNYLRLQKIKWEWNQKKNIIQWIITKKIITKKQGLNKKETDV
jgi:hypothetical protein